MQEILVYLILAVCAAYIVRHVWRVFTNKESCCQGCPHTCTRQAKPGEEDEELPECCRKNKKSCNCCKK